MLFLVLAYEGTDPDAPARRQRVRDRHLVRARELHDAGVLRYVGALLDTDGGMVGSMPVIEADDLAQAQSQVDADAYRGSGVWQDVRIHAFKRAFA